MRTVDRKRADLVFTLLFVILTAAQVAALVFTPLDLAPDEAHYWEWSRRLDYGYYSKGPLIAYLIAGGTTLFGDTSFGVRFPAVVCFASFNLIFYLFARRVFPPLQALVGWITVRVSLAFAQMGIVMTTDSPAALCWLLAVVSLYLAVVEERRRNWLWFGVSLGLGILAKYTLVILYPSVLLLLFVSGSRRHFWCWQFFVGSLLALLIVSPVLFWNELHGWVNFAHNAGHVVKADGPTFNPLLFLEMVAGQLGLVGPILCVLVIYGFVIGYRLSRSGDLAASVFVFSGLPLLLAVVAISFTKRVYANWPIPVFISGILLFTHLHSQRAITPLTRSLVRPAVFLNLLLTVLAHFPFLGVTLGVPGKFLPTKKLVGWSALGNVVDAKLSPEFANDSLAVIADDYEIASEIAFYSERRPKVFCDYLDDRRMNQYDLWARQENSWEKLRGKNALIVLRDPAKIEKLRPRFAKIDALELQPNLRVSYGGADLRSFYLFRGENYDGSVPPLPERR